MASFLLDHNVVAGLKDELSQHGHVAQSAQDLRLHQATDAELLLVATGRKSILVTHDRGFQVLHQAWIVWRRAWSLPPLHHAPLLRFSVALQPPTAYQQIERLLQRHAPSGNELWLWDHRSGDWQFQQPP